MLKNINFVDICGSLIFIFKYVIIIKRNLLLKIWIIKKFYENNVFL